jgi:hypothetical protein
VRPATSRLDARRLLLRATLIVGLAVPGAAFAAKVYKCVDAVTKSTVLRDTPCEDTRGPTPAEVAASAEQARAAAIQAEALRDAQREDRQLLGKYPDEAALRKARTAELEPVTGNIRRAKTRLDQLFVERKPINEERRFYAGKTLPAALKQSIDASDASFAAQADLFRGLQQQVEGIVEKYDREGERLRKLWAGAPSGSMGPLVPAPAASNGR